MSFADKTLSCRDCGSSFTFSAGEQQFYASKGFTNEPTRCQSCRQARKSASNGAPVSDNGTGYTSDAPRGERVAHETVCASCGRPTTVPFVPRGHRPVYCSACFAQMRNR